MADNGSSMYISGAPNDNWNNDDLHNLGSVTAADFDVVQMNLNLYVDQHSNKRGTNHHHVSAASAQSGFRAGTLVTPSWTR